jgi:hypothetical protein
LFKYKRDGSFNTLQYKTDRIGVAVKAKGRSDVSIPLWDRIEVFFETGF